MEQIGRFKVLRRLGGGGFGEVWLAEDAQIGREVAIKVFKPQDENMIAFATSSGTEGLAVLRFRFVNEARILAGLEASPHVVNVLEFGELEDGSPYYVMPYLPASLTDLLGKDVYDVRAMDELAEADQPRSLPLAQCLDILEQVLAGLDAAHSQGLVHRDIKPSNIMLTESGEIRLVDFGIAKMPDSGNSTVSQLGMGSRNYMAPEQKESAKHVDARADVYAFGTVAYRMITGRLPTGRYSDPNVIVPALHQAMNDLIVQCLQEDHTARPDDGSALLAQYRRVRQQQGEASEETSTWVEQGKSSLRDDLKPLKERIEKLLLAQGEITPENHETLTGLARIVDLDDAELNALIKVVTDEHIGVLKPVQNFLALLDEQVAAGTVKRDMLMVAGNAIGWDETRVAAVIAGRQSVGEKLGWIFGGRVFIAAIIAAIVVVLVSIGGFWVYEQQQPAAQERRVAEALAEKIRQEVAGWDKAQRVDTIAAYEDYRSQSFATVAHKEEAGDRIAELKRAAAEALAERSRQEVADWDKAQRVNTIAAYEDYRSQSFATAAHKEEAGRRITGLMNRAVAEELAERSRQEVASWDEAQRINTIASYEDYWSQSFATVARKKEADRRIAELKRAAAERERLVAEELAERIRQEVTSWDEAQRINTIASYEDYRSQSFATVAHKDEADRRIAELKRARVFKDCDVCPEMAVIPSGRFQMGSNSGYAEEKPVHTVTIAKPFALGKTEVTFAEYDAFTQATNRSLADDAGWGRGSRPVIKVNWDDATAYANWLSNKTGKGYRLPSESEWEYAARAGSTRSYSWGGSINCRQARYGHFLYSRDCGNEYKTVVAGSFSANPFGLQDMHGNVREWTQDCWNESYSGAPANGSAWTTSGDCSRRVLRGGSWYDVPVGLRSAYRGRSGPSGRRSSGFRLAQDL